jgi:N-acetylglucosamine repressor
MYEHAASIKEINQRLILNLLRLSPGISRAEISRRTGLGKATVSAIVSELITGGIAAEIGAGVQTGPAGRRPVRLRLNGNFRSAIGVELTGSECVASLTDLYADPMRLLRYPMPESSVETSIEIICQAVRELMDGYDWARLLGIGVGVPGPVNADRQRVIQAENIGWVDVPLGTMLYRQFKKPVMVVKRQNAGALGEYWYGIGKGEPSLLYVSIGIGIGSGMIIGGDLYEGVNGSAGEIGHINITPDGPRCECGNLGCLETFASTTAIATRAKELMRRGRPSILFEWTKGGLESITGRMVLNAAGKGDPLALEVVQEAARYVGIAIATAVNLFNPSMVVIGGEVLELGELFLEPIRDVVRYRSFSISLAGVKIVSSSLGHRAAAIGAATLAINRFFSLNTFPVDAE